MYLSRYTLPLFASLLLLNACQSSGNDQSAAAKPEFDLVKAGKEINEANAEFIELFNNSDSTGLANMFTTDGKSMEPNEPAYTGREAIRRHYAIVMSAGASTLELTTSGLWGDEKLLAEEGVFSFMNKKNIVMDKGKYIVLWKKEEGKWKLFRDCYNSDWPVTAPVK